MFKNVFKLSLLVSSLVVLFACEKPIDGPAPGPDPTPVDPVNPTPDPTPDPEVKPKGTYKIGDVEFSFYDVAVYHEDGAGYNLVLAGRPDCLVPDFDLINDRTVNVLSFDLPESLAGTKLEFDGTTDISTDDWMFYSVSWNPSTYEDVKSYLPSSGYLMIDVADGKLILDCSFVSEDGVRYEMKYDGDVREIDGYIWYGFLNGGSFSVDGVQSISYESGIYYDVKGDGYNMAVMGEEDVIIVDFPASLVGKTSVIGKDKFSTVDDGNVEWSFLSRSDVAGRQQTFVDLEGDFKSGWFVCHHLNRDEKNVAVDMSLETVDGHTVTMHFHGPYKESKTYQVL